MGATAGIVCGKNGFGCTIISGGVPEDHDIEVPANLLSRGEQLCWLSEEARRVVSSGACDVAGVQKAAGGGMFGASPERNEVEAAVQMGLHQAGVVARRLTTESVRAALGVPKAPKAYNTLMRRADVAARSNEQRRHQYLLALAAST